jgi:hypothetical protein
MAVDPRTLIAVPGLERSGRRERERFLEICERKGWDADYLAATISHESGWRPWAANPTSSAVGLLQWTAATARAMGTSRDALLGMTMLEQLWYVELFFSWASHGRPIKPTDFLLLAFGAEHCMPELQDACVLWPPGSAGALANPVFCDEDGAIRVYRLRNQLSNFVARYASKPRLPVAIERESAVERPGAGATKGLVVAGLALLAVAGFALARLLRYSGRNRS